MVLFLKHISFSPAIMKKNSEFTEQDLLHISTAACQVVCKNTCWIPHKEALNTFPWLCRKNEHGEVGGGCESLPMTHKLNSWHVLGQHPSPLLWRDMLSSVLYCLFCIPVTIYSCLQVLLIYQVLHESLHG